MFLILTVISPEVFQLQDQCNQKLVTITIDIEGNVHVVHELRNANTPKQLTFVDGTVSNVQFMNKV